MTVSAGLVLTVPTDRVEKVGDELGDGVVGDGLAVDTAPRVVLVGAGGSVERVPHRGFLLVAYRVIVRRRVRELSRGRWGSLVGGLRSTPLPLAWDCCTDR